jgi:hypothetical protein
MIVALNYGIECRIVGRSFESLNYATESQITLVNGVYNDILVSAIFLITLESTKMIFDIFSVTKSLIGFIKAQSTD